MARIIRREGFALPVALLALMLVAALVTGGLNAALQEDRTSAAVDYSHYAFLAAERGLEDVLGERDRIYFQEDVGAVGQSDTIGPVALDLGDVQAQYTVYVQRLNTRLFKVESEGEVLSGGRYAGSTRRLAEMMRITYTYVPKDRALTTQEPLRIRGQSGISGVDQTPTGWTECDNLGTQTAVVAKDTTAIDVKGAGGLDGSPKKREDATLDSLKFIEYGDMHLDELKGMAEKVYANATLNGMAPASSGGVCTTSELNNWGDPNDPSGACHTYWPIIYSTGDLHLSTGVGQGILIVDGNLNVTGSFEFTGLVFVYGSLKASGNGNKFTGSVNVLGNSDVTELGENTPGSGTGNTQIQLSSCAIERAHMYNERFSRPLPLAEHKFVDVTGLGMN